MRIPIDSPCSHPVLHSSQLMLDHDGVFSRYCCSGDLECDSRVLHINAAYSAGSVALMTSSLPLGAVLDVFGPRVLAFGSNLCVVVGAVLIAMFEDSGEGVDLFSIGFTVLTFAGAGLQLSFSSASNMFPQQEGLIMGILSGTMGASALTPRVLAVINASGISLQ